MIDGVPLSYILFWSLHTLAFPPRLQSCVENRNQNMILNLKKKMIKY
jgi:hypothetical protein